MDVAVLGVGSAGRDVAQACASTGCQVSLFADDATEVMDTIDEIERRLATTVDAGDLAEEKKGATLDRLEATTGLEAAVSDVDIVIDTETADVGVLQRQFADIEELVDRDTLIATSGSAVSVTAAGAGLRYPDRALGLQFHRPLERPLVELVITEQTAATAIDRAELFVDTIEGTAVRVRDSPGLASIRLALAQEVEAMRLVDGSVAGVAGVDQVLTQGYGDATGPLERADRAGLHNRLDVLDYLADAVGDRYEPPEILERLVEQGNTGSGAGEGFYMWESGEPAEPAVPGPDLLGGDTVPEDPGQR
jgi:3-hydroxybutyryl-CoA dehydrogenase